MLDPHSAQSSGPSPSSAGPSKKSGSPPVNVFGVWPKAAPGSMRFPNSSNVEFPPPNTALMGRATLLSGPTSSPGLISGGSWLVATSDDWSDEHSDSTISLIKANAVQANPNVRSVTGARISSNLRICHHSYSSLKASSTPIEDVQSNTARPKKRHTVMRGLRSRPAHAEAGVEGTGRKSAGDRRPYCRESSIIARSPLRSKGR